jgi:hypothetical protein
VIGRVVVSMHNCCAVVHVDLCLSVDVRLLSSWTLTTVMLAELMDYDDVMKARADPI